jgi:hypothetical protein
MKMKIINREYFNRNNRNRTFLVRLSRKLNNKNKVKNKAKIILRSNKIKKKNKINKVRKK